MPTDSKSGLFTTGSSFLLFPDHDVTLVGFDVFPHVPDGETVFELFLSVGVSILVMLFC